MIELLIVIIILGLLGSLVAPQMFSKIGSSQRKTAATQMKMFETALDTYRLDMGKYPSSLQDLLASTDPRWDGPYLPKEVPNDPWDNPYVYTVPGENGKPYSMMSLGADGQVGGSDDNEDVVHR